MTVVLAPAPFFSWFTNQGQPAVGYQLYTYVAGTSTPQATYVDSTQTTPNTNPIILNSAGYASVWLVLGQTYKLVLYDNKGNLVGSQDQITGGISATGANISYTALGINPVATTVQNFLQQQSAASPFNFMTAAQIQDWQLGTYLYDHGPFIQSAVNTLQPVYMPPGNPQLLTPVVCANPGQKIFGAGVGQTILSIPATFLLSAAGIFDVTAPEPSVELTDFFISFYQPNTTTYASLIAYPPAIFMQASPRAKIRRLRISQAKTCIDARLNCGGTYFEDLELSHFDFGLRIDGSEDTMRVLGCHFWPFGAYIPGGGTYSAMSSNLLTLYDLTSNIGISSGRCDGLVIDAALLICGQGVNFYSGTETGLTGATFGTITNTDFDTNSGINISAGNIQVSASNLTTTPGFLAVNHTGGQLAIDTSWFVGAGSGAASIVSNNNSGVNAEFSITDSTFVGAMTTTDTIISITLTSGVTDVTLNDNRFTSLPTSTNQTAPIISIGSGPRLTFTGNTANDKGTGSGILLSIAADAPHLIQGNNFLGWGIALPVAPALLSFSGNSAVASNGTPQLATNKGTRAFAAATTVVVTHGVNAYGAAPSADQIIITPTSAQPTGGFYVSATSTTTFTLTAAASTSMTFGWQVTNATAT